MTKRDDKSAGRGPAAILFDLGGVIVDYRWEEGVARLTGGADEFAGMKSGFPRLGALHAFERGEIDAADFAGAVLAEWPLPVSRAAFIDDYANWVAGLFDGIEALVASLAQTRRVACLSNINTVHWDRCRALGIDRMFEPQFLSHEMGMRKPEPEIFRAVADALDLAPAEILLVDDTMENIDAARKCGMRAEHVTGGDVRPALLRAGAL